MENIWLSSIHRSSIEPRSNLDPSRIRHNLTRTVFFVDFVFKNLYGNLRGIYDCISLIDKIPLELPTCARDFDPQECYLGRGWSAGRGLRATHNGGGEARARGGARADQTFRSVGMGFRGRPRRVARRACFDWPQLLGGEQALRRFVRRPYFEHAAHGNIILNLVSKI